MAIKLTETAIAKATRDAAACDKRIELIDAGCPGLRLRVTPSGTRTWVLACRDREGRMRRFPLGTFPDRGISEARDQSRALHTKVKQEGADPVAQRRRELAIGKAAKEGIGTLQSLLDLYGKHRGSELRTWVEAKRRVEVVFKPFLTRPLATLFASDMQMRADDYPAKQAAAAAVGSLRPVLKWGASRGYVAAEVGVLHPPATARRRDRVLTRDELGALLPALRTSGRPYASALRFMLLTLARREEVGQARWRDIDFAAGTWTIRETKNGQPHIVPLSHQALDLLRGRLPNTTDGSVQAPAREALVFSSRTGEALGNWDRETKKLQERI